LPGKGLWSETYLPDFLLDLLLFLALWVFDPAISSLVPAASSSGGMTARTAPAAAPAKTLTAVSFNLVAVADDFLVVLFFAAPFLLASPLLADFFAGDLEAPELADFFEAPELADDFLLVFFADILFSLN
jgi:hypothetical protein